MAIPHDATNFHLTIKLENDAFHGQEDGGRHNVAEVLRKIANQVENGAGVFTSYIADVNGNNCGYFKFEKE